MNSIRLRNDNINLIFIKNKNIMRQVNVMILDLSFRDFILIILYAMVLIFIIYI